VAQRRGPRYEAEVGLSGDYAGLRVRGRADGFDAQRNLLEEIKTFRGAVEAIAPNHQALHWAQLKVYGWLMCQSRALPGLALELVYFDIVAQTEHPQRAECSADELRHFFELLCGRFLGWARQETAHRAGRDAALEKLEFPQKPFRQGQRELAGAVYRACVQSRCLLVQAPTGIGKTIGTIYPALRAVPVRRIDKVFFLTAKTPGRQVALEALQKIRRGPHDCDSVDLRVVELVARDKACEHPDKACHGDSCPLAKGFYDRLPSARQAATDRAWLDREALRATALAHGICPYYLGQEMLRWSDVVVGDYNYYFDRSAVLYALTVESGWRVGVLVDEAHNLVSRAGAMYSAELTQAQAQEARLLAPWGVQARLGEWLDQWQLLQEADAPVSEGTGWRQLDKVPGPWMRTLHQVNSAIGEYLNEHPARTPSPLLHLYFRTLGFAALAEVFDEHSMCEYEATEIGAGGKLTLRNVVPAPFIAPRIAAADSLVLFSATLNPADYYINLLGLPADTPAVHIPCPFSAQQLNVWVEPLSTRRAHRAASLDALVEVMAAQLARDPGNYMAFFSSFEYMEMAQRRLQQIFADIPVWSQARQMDEVDRQRYLAQFHTTGRGIGFAVLGGIFGEGVDLPGRRLIGAFVATLGLPQFDHINSAICARLERRFGKGYDYTYVFPGLQKVVQAAGRVIRTETDTGSVILLDNRYCEPRYRNLLPTWWKIGAAALPRPAPQARALPR